MVICYHGDSYDNIHVKVTIAMVINITLLMDYMVRSIGYLVSPISSKLAEMLVQQHI